MTTASTPAALRQKLDAVDYLVDEGLATAMHLAVELESSSLVRRRTRRRQDRCGQGLSRARCSVDPTAVLRRPDCVRGALRVELPTSTSGYSARRVTKRQAERCRSLRRGFLQERPILQCIRHIGPVVPVLLIDEIDRADDEFEALLFEFLGEASITIPELGTYTAERRPMVVLTSNRSRELHDALRRRCLYHWIDFPSPERAAEILRRTVPAANEGLILTAADFVGRIRGLDLDKAPGMAETIDWVSALKVLGATELARNEIILTLGAITKTPDDRDAVMAQLGALGYGN